MIYQYLTYQIKINKKLAAILSFMVLMELGLGMIKKALHMKILLSIAHLSLSSLP